MDWLLASPWPMALATGLYVAQAVACWRTGQGGMSLAFASYALANVGLIIAWSPRS